MGDQGSSARVVTAARTPPGCQELLARAEALPPLLREQAASEETDRTLPDEVVSRLSEAGLFRMLTPGRLGGRETRMRTVVAVTELLGVADGSAAWLVALSTAHAWMAGLFSERAQQDVFGADPDAVIAGRIARVAGAVEDPSAEHVDGGVRVGGRFAYASGSHHAKWLLLGARTVDEASHPADLLICLAATSELRVEDTWHTVGLRGTGSNTWVAEDLFGPEPSEREPGRYQRRNRGLLSSPLVASWCAGAVEAFARKGDLAYPYRRLRSHMGADV